MNNNIVVYYGFIMDVFIRPSYRVGSLHMAGSNTFQQLLEESVVEVRHLLSALVIILTNCRKLFKLLSCMHHLLHQVTLIISFCCNIVCGCFFLSIMLVFNNNVAVVSL